LHTAAQVLLTDGQAASARPLLVEAALLRRDRPFAGLPRTPVLEVHSRSVEELWLLATEQRLQIDLDRGAVGELVGELSALVERHPYRERLVGMAIVALTRSGRPRDAARLYRRTAAMLQRELGVEPSRELQTLGRTLTLSD
jgi:DNA-binding SARP family transcriptional activator